MKALVASAAVCLAATPMFAESVTFDSGESPVTLLELYTSEGCSSCPPADAWVSKLKSDPGLWQRFVPVVFHVDYWNGLGWPDRYATPAYSARQRRYAAAWSSNSVYTPGFVRDGREWRDWFQHPTPPTPSAAKAGRLTVTTGEGTAQIVYGGDPNAPKALQVELAVLGDGLESDVKRGENSGRKLRHDFTVLSHTTALLHSEGGRFTASVPLPEKTSDTPAALAVWVTPGDAQPPLQAVGGWLRTR